MLFANVSPGDWAFIAAAVVFVADRIWINIRARDSDRVEAEKARVKEEREAEKEKAELEYRRQLELRELERAAKIEEAAREVRVVKTTLETNTARTDTKLDNIYAYVNHTLEEAQKLYAEKCRDAANDRPTPANLAEADRAEKVYEDHRAQTEKMERNKRTTAMDIATAAAVSPQSAGPITSAELKRDIAEVPEKVADELDQRKQSPEGKAP